MLIANYQQILTIELHILLTVPSKVKGYNIVSLLVVFMLFFGLIFFTFSKIMFLHESVAVDLYILHCYLAVRKLLCGNRWALKFIQTFYKTGYCLHILNTIVLKEKVQIK